MRTQNQPFISIIIPIYNEAENIGAFIPALNTLLESLNIFYEIIVIDDGSTDQSVALIHQVASHMNLKLIQLSRNFGKESALSAGLQAAQGNAVIMMDADFQHPLELIPKMLEHWQAGSDMIYALRTNREGETRFKRACANIFYKLLSFSSSPIVPDAGDFRLLDAKLVKALNAMPERARFMKGLYSWVGFKSLPLPFEVAPRFKGASSFNFRRLMRLAITGLTSFSNLPLRVWIVVGSLISFLALCYASILLIQMLIYGTHIPGVSSLIIVTLFLGGIQLLSIGILGEYISQIFIEVKNRPHYIVAHTHDFSA